MKRFHFYPRKIVTLILWNMVCQNEAVEFIECVCRFHLRLLKLQCERWEALLVLRFTQPACPLRPICPLSLSSPVFLFFYSFLFLLFLFALFFFLFSPPISGFTPACSPYPICPFLYPLTAPRLSLSAPAQGTLAPGNLSLYFQPCSPPPPLHWLYGIVRLSNNVTGRRSPPQLTEHRGAPLGHWHSASMDLEACLGRKKLGPNLLLEPFLCLDCERWSCSRLSLALSPRCSGQQWQWEKKLVGGALHLIHHWSRKSTHLPTALSIPPPKLLPDLKRGQKKGQKVPPI